MRRIFGQCLSLVLIAVCVGGCASQYYHPIKKSAEFYDDLAYCKTEADKQGLDLKGASRDHTVDNCLLRLGWKDQENMCFSRRFESRMPASEVCTK